MRIRLSPWFMLPSNPHLHIHRSRPSQHRPIRHERRLACAQFSSAFGVSMPNMLCARFGHRRPVPCLTAGPLTVTALLPTLERFSGIPPLTRTLDDLSGQFSFSSCFREGIQRCSALGISMRCWRSYWLEVGGGKRFWSPAIMRSMMSVDPSSQDPSCTPILGLSACTLHATGTSHENTVQYIVDVLYGCYVSFLSTTNISIHLLQICPAFLLTLLLIQQSHLSHLSIPISSI